jgi:hypothetical protein
LPHLQLATLDSPKQVPTHSRSHLRRKLQDRKQLAAPTIRQKITPPDSLLLLSRAFFTGSFSRVRVLTSLVLASPLSNFQL